MLSTASLTSWESVAFRRWATSMATGGLSIVVWSLVCQRSAKTLSARPESCASCAVTDIKTRLLAERLIISVSAAGVAVTSTLPSVLSIKLAMRRLMMAAR